jgi:hypothetical protein
VRRSIVAAAALVPLFYGLTVAGSAPAAASPGNPDTPAVWDATVSAAQVPVLARAGADTSELAAVPASGRSAVELVLTGSQARRVRAAGVSLTRHAAAAAPAPQGVFRPYSGPGGLAEELRQVAEDHPDIAKLESIGKTVQGQDILALKVTRNATRTPDGARPATYYFGAQHAREWITPEMVRRLMHKFLDGYGTEADVTSLVDSTELWFMPVANPDGYDYTFSDAPGARLWRKNLRDNNGDGAIAVGDGVDLNRNSGWKWGWDDEGSSPDVTSDLYRGPGPDSEPETVAMNAFERRVKPRFAVNFHSAAQRLMYGIGWQTNTPTPDDVMYQAIVGDPSDSAVPGNRPQIVSDISTSNGDSAGEAVNVNGVPMIADEMASCQTAAASVDGDAWTPADCPSTFQFPDDEKLIEAEYQRNLPFAMSVAESAANPAEPKSSLSRTVAALTPHTFTTALAGTQTVAVIGRKSLGAPTAYYRVNGGQVRTAATRAWKGGQVYGGTDNLYYDEYRGTVTGARANDRVEVWFAAGGQAGRHFTYQVAGAPAGDTLVLADEGAPARNASAYPVPQATVWDVATEGDPDALGVLSHFKNVVWEVGGHSSDVATTLAVRDFMNEGGKLVKAGPAAASNAPLSTTGVNGDDFAQYWLGVDSPSVSSGATGFTGIGANVTFTSPQSADGLFADISDTLPAARYPQFATTPAGTYTGLAGPYEPFAGTGMAAVRHSDNDYARLTRTIDLTGVTADHAPKLTFALSYDTEPGFDGVTFEAHTAGRDDWTTLPDAGGLTSTGAPEDCASLLGSHPFLTHYLTPAGADCTPSGTTGTWNELTGSGNGWHRITLDLSKYAGTSAEVAVTYFSDSSTGGKGAFVDDAQLQIGGVATDTTDFESGLGAFAAAGDSPSVWARSGTVLHSYAALATSRGLTLGFGLESLPASQRGPLLKQALARLR